MPLGQVPPRRCRSASGTSSPRRICAEIQRCPQQGARLGIIRKGHAQARAAATVSPSVSSRAASTPSSDVPLIRPMTFSRLIQVRHLCYAACLPNRVHNMPAAPQFQSEFLRTFVARGAYYDCSDARRTGRAVRQGARHRLYRLRLHRASRCMSAMLVQLDDPAPAAAGWSLAHLADGRRHHQGGRSVRQR